MPAGSSTHSLLGRELEQTELYDALTLALKGEHQVVVVAGDAGIGKTTLVADLANRAEELGFVVATGHCLDIDAGIAFGAAFEAVGSLVAPVSDLDDRPCARRMRALLDPDSPRSSEPFRVLEDLGQTVLEAADAGPVMLVLEDLHWSGRSTQDFAVALTRRGRGRLLLVLTVRTDDLHRRHPARRTLAEISLDPAARRIDLQPLDRDAIAALVAARSGGPAGPWVVASVLARSEGNPLYAEELVAADPEAIPEHLADLFLARVDATADGPRQLLRVASVDGTRVDVETLREVVDLDAASFDSHLRELLDANLLRGHGDSLAFRHGLLREAVYDDLLPDERTRLHADFGAVLHEKVDAAPSARLPLLSRLAFHWSEARDLPRALAASVRAGEAATRLEAPEGVTHLERALSLWDVVPDAEAVAGLHRIRLILRLAESVGFQTDYERRYELVRRALDLVRPDTEPLLVSRVYSVLAFCALFHEDPIGSGEAARRALAYAGESQSEELAAALVASSWHNQFAGRYSTGLTSLERAAEMAEAVGCADVMREAGGLRPQALYYLGRVAEALAELEQTVARERTRGPSGDLFSAMEYLARQYAEAGHVERGLTLAAQGLEQALASGFPSHAGGCADGSIEPLVWSGRLEDATERLEVIHGLGVDHLWAQSSTCELLLARGDVEAAAPLVERAVQHGLSLDNIPDDRWAERQIAVAVLQDDAEAALGAAAAHLAQLEGCDSPLLAGAAARVGFHALALAGPKQGPAVDELRTMATIQRDRARAGLTDEWRGGWYGVQLALAEGYAARVEGRSGIEEFRIAVDLAEPFGAFFVLEPRLELAQELLTHGGRDEGRELLADCWTAAHEMGAHGLERRAAKLATRTRVPLPESGTREGPLSRLTPREREVLDQLARGATNRGIAEALVISEKTVSVHVSNVLAKLGVGNRGEAAALARDLVG